MVVAETVASEDASEGEGAATGEGSHLGDAPAESECIAAGDG